MLNQELGKPPDPLLLRALAIAGINVRNFQQGLAFGDQLLQLADQQDDPILLVEGHYVLGVTLSLGRIVYTIKDSFRTSACAL